jgi:hypothetical protein
MKALTGACMGVLLAAGLPIQPAVAQPQQPPGIIEIVGCNFINDSSGADLARPMNSFNAWADEHDIDDFNVSTLVPIFTSDAFTYDVLFMNRWPNASAMGRGLAAFYGPDGDDSIADFNSVVDCSSTTVFAAILLQPPGEARDGGPIQFFNCTVKENRTVGDGIGAINAWAEAAGDTYGAGHGVLIPLAGENPEATYSFKWVVLHESFENYGDSLGALFGGGGPQLGNIIEPVMDCDSARVYSQIVNRRIQAEN